jgi:hypothetical protein
MVPPPAANVCATGMTYEIESEKAPTTTKHNATLRRRRARRLKRSAASDVQCEPYEVMPFSPQSSAAPL